ncbi:MAG: MBL fold metallo-hydrolase [Gemmatimonadales bacterium]
MRGRNFPAAGTITLIKGTPNIIVDTGDVTQRQELLDALARHQVSVDAIAWVINTHGHLDHIGNNNLFPGATFVLAGDLACGGEYWTHDFARGPLSIACDPAEPAVTVVPTAGHTDHDVSVLVPTAQGLVAVVGDLFEHGRDDEYDAWQHWSQDVPRQLASRARIRAVADYIVPGHGDMFRTRR